MCVCVHVQYVFIRVCVYVFLAVSVHALAPPTRPWKFWDLVWRVCPRSGEAEVVALHRGDLPCSNACIKVLQVSPHGFPDVRYLLISWMGGKGRWKGYMYNWSPKSLVYYSLFIVQYMFASYMHNAHTSNPKGKWWKAPDAPNVDSCATRAWDILRPLFAWVLTRDLYTTACYKGHTIIQNIWFSFVHHPKEPWLHGAFKLLEKGKTSFITVHVPVWSCYLATSQEETSKQMQCNVWLYRTNSAYTSATTQLTNALKCTLEVVYLLY